MKRYVTALQDLLLILIGLGAIILVVSISSSSEGGVTDVDPRVGTFLSIDHSADDEIDEASSDSVSFSDLDGQESNDNAPEVTVESDSAEDEAPTAEQPEVEAEEVAPVENTEDADESEAAAGSEDGVDAGTYVIKAGDTYGCIAESYYGSYENWVDIADANRGVGYQERRLFVGFELQLPAIDTVKPASSLCS